MIEIRSRNIAEAMYLFCLSLRPCCVAFLFVRCWPHSGHCSALLLGVLMFDRLYLHFLQCGADETFLPIRPLMMRISAVSVEAMMMVKNVEVVIIWPLFFGVVQDRRLICSFLCGVEGLGFGR